MLKPVAFFIFLYLSVTVYAQDITGRKYFSYADSYFHLGEVKILYKVDYDFDGGNLRPESYSVIDSVKLFLDEHPQLCLQIGVYTDSKGKTEFNLALSKRRARSVYNYLINKGVDAARIYYKGYGESLPLVKESNADSSDCESCRQQNRRTEIKIINDYYPVASTPDQNDTICTSYYSIQQTGCVYLISFCNWKMKMTTPSKHDTIKLRTLYGDIIGDTIIRSSKEEIKYGSPKLSWTAHDKCYFNFNDSLPTSPQELVVTSCDGKIKYEIEYIHFFLYGDDRDYIFTYNPFIDLRELKAAMQKPHSTWEIQDIQLKGLAQLSTLNFEFLRK